MSRTEPLIDGFGRRHNNLRISVTDRCNIRCFYCMPNERLVFKPRDELLRYEEIERFVRALVPCGVTRLRITGGEPLVRSGLPKLVAALAAISGVEDVALTTNGILLPRFAAELRQAGLHRLNISLDTLREETFQQLTRRPGVQQVLDGIRSAREQGFRKIRLNAVSIRGITDDEIEPLVQFAREQRLELRVIEYMPLDSEQTWQRDHVLDGATIRERITRVFGPLRPASRSDPSQPALDYQFADGSRIGFINPVSEPFCGTCSRLRLTAEGQVRNCLFSTVEWDVRAILRSGGGDEDIVRLVRESIRAKKPGHGIDSPDFLRPRRAMYQIGG